MCTGIEIAALAAYAGGTYMEQQSAKRAIQREGDAYRQLGTDLDMRQKRIADMDQEVGGVVDSLRKLYGREDGFDANMADQAKQSEAETLDLITKQRAANVAAPSAGEATTLGEQLVRDATVVANEKNDRFVKQQVSANANLRSLSDALGAITPDLIGGNSELAILKNNQRGESTLSDYDNRIFQQEQINARRSAYDPAAQGLKLAGQLAGMYSLMAAAPTAAGTEAAGTGLKASSGGIGLKAPTSGYSGFGLKPF